MQTPALNTFRCSTQLAGAILVGLTIQLPKLNACNELKFSLDSIKTTSLWNRPKSARQKSQVQFCWPSSSLFPQLRTLALPNHCVQDSPELLRHPLVLCSQTASPGSFHPHTWGTSRTVLYFQQTSGKLKPLQEPGTVIVKFVLNV